MNNVTTISHFVNRDEEKRKSQFNELTRLMIRSELKKTEQIDLNKASYPTKME